ncbi:MAG: FxsA family protein, partial [Gammaproteobacteria bacterium]|nr:FxsA family protein [Gammaproteobacteria bacterium]
MLSRLALIFVAVPLLELFLLIRLGGAIGLLPTLSLCVLTGVAGAWLARREGLRALWSFQQRLASGGVPGRALMDGLCILLGGALLLTPGLLTDVVGFSLLVPPSRRWIQKRIRSRIERQLADGSLQVTTIGGFPGAGGASARAGGASGWGF